MPVTMGRNMTSSVCSTSAPCKTVPCVMRSSRRSLKVQAVAAPVERVSTRAQRPDNTGRFGKYGGKYVPETLMPALEQLEIDYRAAMADPAYHVSSWCLTCLTPKRRTGDGCVASPTAVTAPL